MNGGRLVSTSIRFDYGIHPRLPAASTQENRLHYHSPYQEGINEQPVAGKLWPNSLNRNNLYASGGQPPRPSVFLSSYA
jgi:hypothetical protein